MRLTFLLLSATLALIGASGCDQQQPGDPIVRTPIRNSSGEQVPAGARQRVDDPQVQVESSCRPVIFENTSFTHCLAVPARHQIETAWTGSDGVPFRGFAAYAASRGEDAAPIAFAFNAGMFDQDGEPTGYFVKNGERLQTLDTAGGDGDFYSKPNGVFFGNDQEWQILTSEDFQTDVSERPSFGTQSGPMLVINGRLHPDIVSDGEERVFRNAVGLDNEGRAHFVISNAPVSFGKLARLYRDKLEVENALYLDGKVSSLWSPANGRMDDSSPLGPLIIVTKRANGE